MRSGTFRLAAERPPRFSCLRERLENMDAFFSRKIEISWFRRISLFIFTAETPRTQRSQEAEKRGGRILSLLREGRGVSGGKAGPPKAACRKKIKLSKNGGKVASLSDEDIVAENSSEGPGPISRIIV